MLHKITFYRHI